MSFIPETFRDRPYAAKHFREIVDDVRATHPFYREWLADPDHVPIMSRTEFLENNHSILNGVAATTRTSGSTGIPVQIAKSADRAQMDQVDEELVVQWLGGRMECTRIIHPPSDDLPEWMMDIRESIGNQLKFLRQRYEDCGSIALTTYLTNAEMLAREIRDRKLDMSFIARVGVYAEALEPTQEAMIREAFPNAQFWTTYSSMEFGMIAIRCPHDQQHHHIMAHKLGLEVLRDDGSPCDPGELGRVVITDYFNRVSPLIRYEIGDLAARGACPCGTTRLPALGEIVGKVRGSLLHRDGRRVVFTSLSVALRDIPGMRQYQVVQDGVEEICVKYVAHRELSQEIMSVIETEFGYLPKELTTESVNEIARGANGKYYASICNV